MKTIKIDGKLHRDGDGEVRLYCNIPKDEFPQLIQGDDYLTDAIVEITILDTKS